METDVCERISFWSATQQPEEARCAILLFSQGYGPWHRAKTNGQACVFGDNNSSLLGLANNNNNASLEYRMSLMISFKTIQPLGSLLKGYFWPRFFSQNI